MGYYVNSFDVDIQVKNAPTELLNELADDGFHFEAFDDPTLLTVYDINGKWSWIEEDLLKLAPYIVEPGYAYFSGEDYDQFRVVFDDNTMSIYDSKIVFFDKPSIETRY